MSACASKPLRASENLRVGSQNLFAHHGQFYMCQKCGVLCYFMKGMEKPSGGLGACFGSSAGHWFTGSPTYALFGQAPGPISTTPPPQFGYQNNFRHCAACNGVFYGAYWGPNTTSYCPAGGTSSNTNHVATGAIYYVVLQAGAPSTTYYPGDPNPHLSFFPVIVSLHLKVESVYY